ncbi:heme ABC exporter ATP-binding protein CcmA [Paroceanicella profunda]|uniref:Heme ABC exporter ATP-binding protein CcmA n=1 Tax=Paroceanicella profunda TaxID=2579971 RepID=A0A5B8G199_9RHOB|nr:heme ABC exporter ATP-binding protein CcmA [Paroceanicella profunda]QDL92842.1 heme ABC exporter ATP-binding protein CcmA [Paroceanicella profunda]
MSLILRDLGVARGGRMVVSGLDFSLAPGEAALLRGPNGAGKSTLLRALAGLLPLAAGSATLMGADLAQEPDTVQEQLAYAGHLDAVKPQMTVAENLAFQARLFGAPDAGPALALFGLAALADRPAGACSAGQKRRIGLARLALAARPLWLLDEPTVSLDADAVADFAGMVRAHCAGGGMALVATHIDLGLSEARVLRLEPVSAAVRESADPFLGDAWEDGL